MSLISTLNHHADVGSQLFHMILRLTVPFFRISAQVPPLFPRNPLSPLSDPFKGALKLLTSKANS